MLRAPPLLLVLPMPPLLLPSPLGRLHLLPPLLPPRRVVPVDASAARLAVPPPLPVPVVLTPLVQVLAPAARPPALLPPAAPHLPPPLPVVLLPRPARLAVLPPLRQLDEVAYLRFASVYNAFDSLDDFEDAIRALRHPPPALADIKGKSFNPWAPSANIKGRRGKQGVDEIIEAETD
jgi:hypothetical protein